MKDVTIRIIKNGCKAGCLFISNRMGTNAEFFDPTDPVERVINWLYQQADIPEFCPKDADPQSPEATEGREAAMRSIDGEIQGCRLCNPYDKYIQYNKWNDWQAGWYYTMK